MGPDIAGAAGDQNVGRRGRLSELNHGGLTLARRLCSGNRPRRTIVRSGIAARPRQDAEYAGWEWGAGTVGWLRVHGQPDRQTFHRSDATDRAPGTDIRS